MNKRIQELAKNAGLEMCGCGCDMPTRQSAKFAELIVKECCFTGEQWADGLIDPKHYAFVNKMIREHFGVKE